MSFSQTDNLREDLLSFRDSVDARLVEIRDVLPRVQSYARIADVKVAGVHGGTFTSGAWRVRDLQTEIADPDGIVTISANGIILQDGKYWIGASAPANNVDSHQTRLFNVNDSVTEITGTSEESTNTLFMTTRSFVGGFVSISIQTEFEVQHQCNTTIATFGFGVAGSFGSEVYTVVDIYKLDD